jgi:hypothetical protein
MRFWLSKLANTAVAALLECNIGFVYEDVLIKLRLVTVRMLC